MDRAVSEVGLPCNSDHNVEGDTGPRPAALDIASSAWNEGYLNVPEDFTITEKAPTRAFSWLKAATTALTFKTLC